MNFDRISITYLKIFSMYIIEIKPSFLQLKVLFFDFFELIKALGDFSSNLRINL